VAGEKRWLTIPVEVKGRFTQRIDETRIADASWADTHFKTIVHAYRRAPHFDEVAALLEELYGRHGGEELLSEVNAGFLRGIGASLGMEPPWVGSSERNTRDEPSLRLLDLTLAAGANEYVSGPAAKDYLDVPAFEREGVRVGWADYEGYPEYPQGEGPF